jgi:hypothetical protein
MSELVNTRDGRKDFRWQLLTTASAVALLGLGASVALAADDDSDRPVFWIELGGQLSRLDDGQEAFTPTFPNSPPRPSIFSPSQKFERLPLYSIDETGKVSFEPDGSNWVFSAAVRYGRSISKRDVHQQTYPQPTHIHFTLPNGTHSSYIGPFGVAAGARAADTTVRNGEQHLILDFQAGKDVGLGMFGVRDGSSVVNVGVRFAQFSRQSNISLKSDPDWHRIYRYFNYPSIGFVQSVARYQVYHSNAASLRATRSFHGVGPSLSWNASAPFAGNKKDGELLFDWGANAALLFGRQKARVHHQATAEYRPSQTVGVTGIARYYPHRHLVSHYSADPPARSRTVIVPNIGGFAGLSFRYNDAKISLGYRADLFLGPMDGGIDAAKKENVGFYGPFATISIGWGG